MRKTKTAKISDAAVVELLQRHRLPEGIFRPDDTLAHAFTVASTRVSQVLQNMYTEHFGLTVAAWRLLAILGHQAPLSAKELSDITAMDQVTISRTLELMSSKSLLQRRIDQTDRRRTLIRLNKSGQEVYSQIVPVLYAGEMAMLSGLTGEEVKTLKFLMRKIVDRCAEALPEDAGWREMLECYGYDADPAGDGGDAEDGKVPDKGDIPVRDEV